MFIPHILKAVAQSTVALDDERSDEQTKRNVLLAVCLLSSNTGHFRSQNSSSHVLKYPMLVLKAESSFCVSKIGQSVIS